MPKCYFNKVANQLYLNRTWARVFSCKFATYFQNTFSQEHLWVSTSIFLQQTKTIHWGLNEGNDSPELLTTIPTCSRFVRITYLH